MPNRNIFQAINPTYVQKILRQKKEIYFPDLKNSKIKDIKVKRINPDWAKETCLVKYTISFENEKKKVLRGTAKKDRSKESVWQIMNHLYRHGFNKKNLNIPRPVDFIKSINLLIYEEVAGFPLAMTIQKKNIPAIKTNFKKAAHWLTKLHNLQTPNRKLPKALFLGSQEYIKMMKMIKKLMPQIKDGLIPSSKLKFIDKTWSFKKTLIHNDFYPWNIIVNSKNFSVIDLDRSGFGPPLADIATLYGALEFPKNIWSTGLSEIKIRGLQKFFLATYCKFNDLNYQEILEKLKPFLTKVFLDQMHYYIGFSIKGWRFLNQKEKESYRGKIENALFKARRYLP